MEIKSRNEFAADPTTVAEMLTTEGFLAAVCQESGATSHQVSVDGTRTVSRRELPAPPQAAKFTGPAITVVEEVSWSAAVADGSREGRLVISVPGLPVDMAGTARLHPGGKGTVVEYEGTFKVNIPFVGRKLEQQAAPAIVEALGVQQRVGDAWLSR